MKKTGIVIPLILGALATASNYGCQSASKASENEKNSCLMEEMDGRISIETISRAAFNEELVLSGHVTFNQNKVVPFLPLVSGNILQVRFELGDHVKKGQVMAVIRSIELEELQKELLAARSDLQLAQRQYDLQKSLHEGGISSSTDVLLAETELEKALAGLNRVNRLLEIYGGSSSGTEQIIRAPATGYVVQKNMNPGMHLDPGGEPAFTISDLEDVWVIANVYQSDLSRVRINQPVRVESHAFPGKTFEGSINNISNVLDPEEKVLKVRVQLKNEDNLLKPGIFAKVIVENETGLSYPVIPASALVFDRNRHYVMISKGDCLPETREVKLYSQQNGKAFIKDGLQEGERLVSRNQLLIYNALNY